MRFRACPCQHPICAWLWGHSDQCGSSSVPFAPSSWSICWPSAGPRFASRQGYLFSSCPYFPSLLYKMFHLLNSHDDEIVILQYCCLVNVCFMPGIVHALSFLSQQPSQGSLFIHILQIMKQTLRGLGLQKWYLSHYSIQRSSSPLTVYGKHPLLPIFDHPHRPWNFDEPIREFCSDLPKPTGSPFHTPIWYTEGPWLPLSFSNPRDGVRGREHIPGPHIESTLLPLMLHPSVPVP